MMNGQEASALVAPVAAAAREMLRLAGNDEDALLLRLAMTALGLAEAFCGQRLLRRADADGLAESWSDLPPPIAHGLVLMAVHLFENRHAEIGVPIAVAALWRPWRRLGL
ncbi:head-tail connector protein [Sphingomonas abaci]|uniref:Phage gp6-like head-tail connector protein n=1 Tax=Sphingomonas abaci TaxID=237611 RepID=A0A7W7ALP0_9SPHN|nr:head-tail connector protein [Sphingomonas abaci]MBB4619344.1 hypothetical protein [Sphingomonas abaci]